MISLPTLRGLATILVCLSCLSAAYSVPRARLDPEMHETKNVTTELSRRVTPSNMVFAHFMVGFTANYSVPSWENDITLAKAKGIDAFALNLGPDGWQVAQIANAYTAATNKGFKMFLSFDMTAWPCQSSSDANAIRQFISQYSGHSQQVLVDGKMLISTFSGERCTFGSGDVNTGWVNTLKTNLPPVFFVPSLFVDPASFGGYPVIDGVLNWNGAWPMGSDDISFTNDQPWINGLGGRAYMAGVSPWFFTHYGPDTFNKNWIYRADDWLWATRWEQLIQNRDKVPFAEVITWNDYSESHYIGAIDGVQPNSQSWTNGYDHQGWLDLMSYYITAYKTGSYPAVTKDRIFLWGRLYPAAANSPDPVARPNNWQWTQDYLWAVVLMRSSGSVTLSCGSTVQTFNVTAGLSKLKLPLSNICSVTSKITRNGRTSLSFTPPGFNFNTSPPSYNFNAFVAASPS